MRQLLSPMAAAFSLLLALAYGCEPCRFADYVPEASLSLRFLSKADSTSLVGVGAPYSFSNLDIVVLASDGTHPAANYHADATDRQVFVYLPVQDSVLLLRLDTLPVDTLRLALRYTKGKHCAETVIDGGSLNGQPVLLGADKTSLAIFK